MDPAHKHCGTQRGSEKYTASQGSIPVGGVASPYLVKKVLRECYEEAGAHLEFTKTLAQVWNNLFCKHDGGNMKVCTRVLLMSPE